MGQKPANIPEDILRKLYLEDRLSQKEIAEKLGCSDGAVWRRLIKHGIVRRPRSEVSLLTNNSYRRDFDGDGYIKAYIIGFSKGDIHVWMRGKNSQTVRLVSSTTMTEQVELFKSLFSPYGHVHIGEPKNQNVKRLTAFLNMSMAFLLDREDTVPQWILEDEETFFAFFAGYVDAEAHIGVHNGYAVFKLDSCDKNTIFQSWEKLSQANISGPKPFICATKGYTNKHGYAYREDMWRLQVGAKSSLIQLFERLEPYLKHRKRISDMEAAIQNVKQRDAKKYKKHAEETSICPS